VTRRGRGWYSTPAIPGLRQPWIGLSGRTCASPRLFRRGCPYRSMTPFCRPDAGSWKLADRSVELHWTDRAAFFESLFANSFKLTTSGLIWLTALGDPADNLQQAVLVHNAVLGSFLQHIQTRKADPANHPKGAVAYELGDETCAVRFQRVYSYAHQKAHLDLAEPGGVTVPGWLFPGAAVRHVAHGDTTAFVETPERRLALLYAPAGVVYFQVTRRGRGRRPRFALVVPEISDLRSYAEARRALLPLGMKELQATPSNSVHKSYSKK
jgi:CRISPR-associated protein Cas8a1/Csx13